MTALCASMCSSDDYELDYDECYFDRIRELESDIDATCIALETYREELSVSMIALEHAVIDIDADDSLQTLLSMRSEHVDLCSDNIRELEAQLQVLIIERNDYISKTHS